MTRVENIQKEGNTKKAGRHTHTHTHNWYSTFVIVVVVVVVAVDRWTTPFHNFKKEKLVQRVINNQSFYI